MSSRVGVAWRFAALGGLGAGLALAPAAAPAAAPLPVLAALTGSLVVVRPRPRGALPWLCLVAAVAALTGLAIGAARLGAIDAAALEPADGAWVDARGTVDSTPRTSNGITRFALEAGGRRIGVESRASATGIDEGRVVRIRGTVRLPAPWEAEMLARQGVTRVVAADHVRPTGEVRGGLRGALDAIRRRAENALERGTPGVSAALLRGFVLGQDDRIPEPVRDEFRRSGLAHVLAVSGQNVMLLAVLATPILALAGVPLRARLLALLALIALYVPVAGAGPSIQRAGVMGAAGLVAALAGRPSARWYALLLAVAVTLTLDPRATGDVGWQLSFAAVAGLLVLAAPLSRALIGRQPARPGRRLMAEGAAMTLAATLATAPLAAHHFGVVSLTAIPANMLALPAVAPAMWLGMLAGALGQVPAAPVEPLTALGGLCAGFIGWIAHVFGGERAQLEIAEPGLGTAIALAAGSLVAARLACLALERRATLRPRWRGRISRPLVTATCIAVLVALAGAVGLSGGPVDDDRTPPTLVVRVLDVGQGDSILLEPRGALPVLIDAGPPGGAAVTRLDELGIGRLGALAITHDQLDHSGALPELLEAVEVDSLVFGVAGVPAYCGLAACPRSRAVRAGETIRSGRLRLDVLWPNAGRFPADNEDPNARSLVLRARLGKFEGLLTGDAEAESAPVDPGPVDLLKVAHHGSADSGLAALLARASPNLAVISVVAVSLKKKPAPETLSTLAAGEVPVQRTDEDGEVVIEVRGDGWTVG